MAFLTVEELKTKAPKSFLDIVIGTDTDVIGDILDETVDLFKMNLGSYYDVDQIFSSTGADRSKTVLKYVKDIIYYQLLKRRKPGMADTSDYDEAMKWLEDISGGKRKADLPPKLIDIDGDGDLDKETPFMKLGGRRNYPNYF